MKSGKLKNWKNYFTANKENHEGQSERVMKKLVSELVNKIRHMPSSKVSLSIFGSTILFAVVI